MSRRSQRNASKAPVLYKEDFSSDDKENSIIVSSNMRVFSAGSSSSTGTATATDEASEEDTQPLVDFGPRPGSTSSQEVTSTDSFEKMLNNANYDSSGHGNEQDDEIDEYPSLPSSPEPITDYKSNGRKMDMPGLGNGKSKSKKASEAFQLDRDGENTEEEEQTCGQSSTKSNLKGLSLAGLLRKDSQGNTEKEQDSDPAAFLRSRGDKSQANNSLEIDAFLGCSQDKVGKNTPKSSKKRRRDNTGGRGISIAGLMGKSRQKRTKVNSPSKCEEGLKQVNDEFDDFLGFSLEDVESASPKKKNMDELVEKAAKISREEDRMNNKTALRKLAYNESETEHETMDGLEKKKSKSKASSAFNIEGMLNSEMNRFASEAKSLVGNSVNKTYMLKQRRMMKKMMGQASRSTTVKKTKKVPKNQPLIDGFLSPKSEGNESPVSSYLGNESENEDVPQKETEDDCLEILVTAEQIECTSNLSLDCDSVDDYVRKLQEIKKAEEEEALQQAEAGEQRKKHDEDRRLYRKRNWDLKVTLHETLIEAETRRLIKKHFVYLQDLWDGTGLSQESARYRTFQRGGRARAALLYTAITHPFTDDQVEWIMEEIRAKWMYTEQLYYKHNDFAWKVVLPEALIKLYMVVNGIESRTEAEDRMAKTPWKCPS